MSAKGPGLQDETDVKTVQNNSQDSRLVSTHLANKLEAEKRKLWDLFYKRNECRFFKDRHWTLVEFKDILQFSKEEPDVDSANDFDKNRSLLEIGCGVGNFIYPLLLEGLDYFVFACDFSKRAINFVKSNPAYDEEKMHAFECDITRDDLLNCMHGREADVASMVFVLSAIHPQNHHSSLKNIHKALKAGGIVILRDYGRNDMTQLRFGPGSKIFDNFYARQDGTRSYFFDVDELRKLFTNSGFDVKRCEYVHRRTVNIKEGIDVPRIFVHGIFQKSLDEENTPS